MTDPTTRPSTRGARLVGPPALWVVLAVALVLATAWSWMLPTTTGARELRPSTVEYAFDYDAVLPPNPVYEGASLTFGEAVFLSVVPAVDVEVAFTTMGDAIAVTAGELTTRVVVSSSAGWVRTLSTTAPTPIQGPRALARAHVDFAAALALADQIGRTTGTKGSLQVSVVAEATVDGHPASGTSTVDGTSAADLTFALTSSTASPTMPATLATDQQGRAAVLPGIVPGTGGASTETGGASTRTGSASTATGGASTETGGASTGTGGASRRTGEPDATDKVSGVGVRRVTQMVSTDSSRPARVDLGLFTIDVAALRKLLTPLALLCTAMAVLSLFIATNARRRGEAAWIAARYGSRLVGADRIPEARAANAVELSSFGALRSIGAELEQMILVDDSGPGTAYYITDGATTYRYRTRSTTTHIETDADHAEDPARS